MKGRERYFYFTKTDLIEIIQCIESENSFKYINGLYSDTKNFITLNTLEEYEYLGIDLLGTRMSQFFMVLDRHEELDYKEIKLTAGGVRYSLVQERNKNSIILRPSGIYDNEYLIVGMISTISSSAESMKIFNVFEKAFKKLSYKKVGRYYIGKNAINLYGKMRFIAIGITQPSEYDLKIESM